MKNLKKVLALVLALASVMGLGVSASAKEYSDADSIKYTEAVDVMSAVGILSGKPDGNFHPTDSLTRAQAAKMVTYILNSGVDVNDLYAGANKFTDCTNNWAKGYIAYANQAGIVSGVGNGKFNPDGTLTGVALAKMMLCSLGYDAKVEGYVSNDSWMVNVLSDAKKAGLLDELSMVDMYKPITREEASQMMFNALKANMVEYETKGTEIDLGNGSVTIGASAAKPVTVPNGETWAGKIDPTLDAVNNNYQIVQLGEQYLRSLNRITTQTDAFNRPASVWTITKNGVANTIGTYTDTPVLTYTTEVKEDALYKALGLDSTKYVIDTYVDGVQTHNGQNTSTIDDYALAKNSTEVAEGTDNGVLTEIFTSVKNDTTYITISQIHNYVGEVVAVNDATATNPRSVNIAGYTAAAGKFETDSFAKGDVVTYTASKKDGTTAVQSAALATQVKGKMTSYVGDTSVTVDGTVYNYSADIKDMADGAVLNKDVTLYLDPYGYVLNIGGVVASTQYAYMLKYNANGGTYGDTDVAQLLMADGTIVDAQVKEVNDGTWSDDKFTSTSDDKITTGETGVVSYTVDSNGKYTLTGVGCTTSGNVDLVKGSSTIKLGSSTIGGDANTIVLVKTGTNAEPIYTAYTGIANMPTVSTDSTLDYAVATNTTGTTAKLIFVDANDSTDAVVSTSADAAAYILYNAKTGVTKDADGEYYIRKAVVNGEVKEIKVDASYDATLFSKTSNKGVAVNNLSFNSKGIVVSASVSMAVNNARGTTAMKNDVIGLGGSAYSYTNDCVVFYVETKDDSQSITASTISGLLTDDSDYVNFVKDANGNVVAVFVEKFETTEVNVHTMTLNSQGVSLYGTTGSVTVDAKAGTKLDLVVNMQADSKNATVSVKDLPAVMPSADASKTVTVLISAEKGSKTTTYTLTVNLTVNP